MNPYHLCINNSNNVFNIIPNWRPFLTFDMLESSHQYPRNHLGVVMRFVSLWPGCVAGLGDMMSERERDVVTLELTLGHNLGRGEHSLGRRYPACTVYCAVYCAASSAADGGGGEDQDHPGGRGRGWPQGDDGCCQRLVRLIPSSIASWLSIQRLHEHQEHHNQPLLPRTRGSIQRWQQPECRAPPLVSPGLSVAGWTNHSVRDIGYSHTLAPGLEAGVLWGQWPGLVSLTWSSELPAARSAV